MFGDNYKDESSVSIEDIEKLAKLVRLIKILGLGQNISFHNEWTEADGKWLTDENGKYTTPDKWIYSEKGEKAIRKKLREWCIEGNYIDIKMNRNWMTLNLYRLDKYKAPEFAQSFSGDCEEAVIWIDALLWVDGEMSG